MLRMLMNLYKGNKVRMVVGLGVGCRPSFFGVWVWACPALVAGAIWLTTPTYIVHRSYACVQNSKPRTQLACLCVMRSEKGGLIKTAKTRRFYLAILFICFELRDGFVTYVYAHFTSTTRKILLFLRQLSREECAE